MLKFFNEKAKVIIDINYYFKEDFNHYYELTL